MKEKKLTDREHLIEIATTVKFIRADVVSLKADVKSLNAFKFKAIGAAIMIGAVSGMIFELFHGTHP